MSLYCPFCTKEIRLEMTQCPSCGNMFGAETRKFIKTLVDQMPSEYPNERRKHARVHKTFKIVFPTPGAFIKYYLSDIGTGGLFIKTTNPLNQGETFKLRLFLPNGGKELEVACEVVWSHKKERATPQRKFPPGMGIKFLNLSPEGKKEIMSVLSHAVH